MTIDYELLQLQRKRLNDIIITEREHALSVREKDALLGIQNLLNGISDALHDHKEAILHLHKKEG